MRGQFRNYYYLAKPGIIYGNLISLVAGYLFASNWHIKFLQFSFLVLGTALVIGGACVLNNILDRNVDAKMDRTKKRALVLNTIKVSNAFVYGILLSLIGFLMLANVSFKVLGLGIIGYLVYVLIYGFLKRKTTLNTLVGAVAGSIPITSGYVAYSDRLDKTAVVLFLIMAAWQMAHFYSIAIYRLKDYKLAGLKMSPVLRPIKSVQNEIIFYILVFLMLNTVLVTFYKNISPLFLIAVLIVSLYWLYKDFKGLRMVDSSQWGKKSFKLSLIVLMVFSFGLALAKLI